jgi:hypothetical protein
MAKILLQPRPSLRKLIPASPSIARRYAPRDLEIERCECSRMRRLLQCRLAWYGFRAIRLGSLRDLSESTASVDLFRNDGSFLGRVEVDRQSGKVDLSAGRALTHLLNVAV